MRGLLLCFAALAAARAPGPFGQSGDAPLPVHETKSTAMPTDANSKEQTFVRRRAVPAATLARAPPRSPPARRAAHAHARPLTAAARAPQNWDIEPEEHDPEFLQTGESMMTGQGEMQELQCTCDKMKCNCQKKCECVVPTTS